MFYFVTLSLVQMKQYVSGGTISHDGDMSFVHITPKQYNTLFCSLFVSPVLLRVVGSFCVQTAIQSISTLTRMVH